MKRILWGLLILGSLVVSGCGAGGKVDGAATTDTGGVPVVIDPTVSVGDKVTISSVASLVAYGSDPANPVSSQSLIKATITNSSGTLVPNQQVFFYTNGGGTFSPSNAVTDTDGDGMVEVTFTAPATLGQVTINARCGLSKSNDISPTIIAGPPATIQVYPAKNQLGPGGTTEVVVFVSDANSYPVAGKTLTANVSTNATGAQPSFLGVPTTDAAGKATLTYTAGSGVGADIIEVKSGTITQTATINVVQSAASIDSFSFGQARTETILIADGTDTDTLRVKILDTDRKGVPGVSIVFRVDNGLLDDDVNDGVVGAKTQTVLTDSLGEAVAFLVAPVKPGKGRVTVNASSGDFAFLDYSYVAGPAANVTLNAAPNNLGPAETSLLSVVVTDALGNPVPNDRLTFRVTTNGTGTAAALSAANAITDEFGEAAVTYKAGNLAGTDIVTVTTSNSTSNTANLIVSPNNVTVGNVSLSADVTTPLVADGSSTRFLTATVLDTEGKPAVGKTVTFVATFGTIISPDADNTVAGVQVLTTAAGTAKATFKVGIVAGAGKVSATSDGLNNDVAFTLTPGAPTLLETSFDLTTFTPPAANLISGRKLPLYARVKDANNNLVPGVSISFAFTGVQNKSGATLSAASDITDAVGVAGIDYTAGVVAPAVDIVTISTGGLSSTLSINVQPEITNMTFDKAALFLATDPLAPSGQKTESVTVTAYDLNNKPLPGVSLTVTSNGNALPNASPTAPTNSEGKTTILFTDLVNENVIITFRSGEFSKTLPLYSGVAIDLNPSTGNGVADGTTPVVFTATVRDFAGRVLTDKEVVFTGTAPVFLEGSPATTNALGQAVVNARSNRTTGLTPVTLRASVGAVYDDATADFIPGPPAVVTLTATSTSLSLASPATITAVVKDSQGNTVADNTEVKFTLNNDIGLVTATAWTTNGTATAAFDAGTKAGTATVTATAGSVNKALQLIVQPRSAGVIEVASVEPTERMIHVLGTEGNQTAKLTYSVKDGPGNPVADGTSVTISIPAVNTPGSLGGGEQLTYDGLTYADSVVAKTVNGLVTVTLRAGSIPGTVSVTAKVGVISTMARVTIVGGQPDSKHISLAAAYLNVAGGVTFGLQDTITVRLGDRFGNVPLDGTPVSFYSECGTIGDSTGFTLQSVHGVIETHLHTQNPTTPNLRGVDADSDGAGDGNAGFCTILTVTPGSEYFEDNNGNGLYDAGDSCTGDQGEPYIDGNDNDAFDVGEFYVDTDRNGAYTGADATCSPYTSIWTSMPILMSGYETSLNPTVVPDPAKGQQWGDTGFQIPIGGYQQFYFNLADRFGNALVVGTKVTVTTDNGTLGGITEFVMPDTTDLGYFWGGDRDADGVNDYGIDLDADGTLDLGVPLSFVLFAELKPEAETKMAKVTITLTPPASGPQGNNGAAQSITLIGTINLKTEAGATNYVDKITINAEAEEAVAGGSDIYFRVTALDKDGSPVTAKSLTLSSGGGTFLDTLGNPVTTVTTNLQGVAFANFKPGLYAGDFTINAAADGVFGSTKIKLLPGTPSNVSLSATPSSVQIKGETTLTAQVSDANGNATPGIPVTFTLVTNNTNGTLEKLVATTDLDGLAKVKYTAGNVLTAISVQDRIRADVTGGSGFVDITVTAAISAVSNVTVIPSMTEIAADGTSTMTVQVVVGKTVGQGIEAVPGVSVYFSAPLGSTLSAPSAITDVSGSASVTLTAGTKAGKGKILATAGSVQEGADITFVAGAVDSSKSILTVAPTTVKPTGTSTVVLAVRDANDNPVVGKMVLFTLTTNNTGGTISSFANTSANGEATATYVAGNRDGVDTVTASIGAAIKTATITVDSTATIVGSLILSANPTSVPADGFSTSMFTAKVFDINGLPAAGKIVKYEIISGSGTLLQIDNSDTDVATLSANTGANGEAKMVYKTDTTLGIVTIKATVDGVSRTVNINRLDRVDSLILTVDADAIVAGGVVPTNSTTVTATVLDIDNAPLSGVTVNFRTTRGTLSAASAVTNASGQAAVTLTSSTLIGHALVTANYGTISNSAPVDFVVGPPAQVTMTASPSTIPYGGQTSLTVTVVDAQTRPVPNANLYFGFSPDATGNQSGGTYNVTSGTTDAQGRLTLTYTAGNVTANDTLLVETEVSGVTDTLLITLDTAAAAIGNMTLAAPSLSSIVANGVTTAQLTATVTDGLGAALGGVPVSFATTYGTIDSDGTPQTKTVTTNTLGKATVTLTSTTTVGTAYVTAVTAGFQRQQSVAFIPGNPVWKNAGGTIVSSLTPVNGSLAADGTSTTTVNAVLKDINGNLVADGTSVTLLSTLGTVLANPVVTNNGIATFTVTAPRTAGRATLSLASVPGLTAAIEFGANSGANIGAMTLTAVTSNLTVTGVGQPASTTITLQAFEADGSPIDESFWGSNNTVRVELINHPNGSEFIAGTGGLCSNPAFTTEATCIAVPATWQTGRFVTTTPASEFIDIRTQNGTATFTLQAGTLPGVIELKATALDENGVVATPAVTAALSTITIAAGPPHAITLIPGTPALQANTDLYGRTGTIIATDRFGNAVPDGTELNLGLVDTVISAATAAATTTASSSILNGIFANTGIRAVQANDRVLIPNAPDVDRNRFIASGTIAPFTVTQSYNNAGVALNAFIGAALQGGYVSGVDTTVTPAVPILGRTITTNGIATLNVIYPTSLTTNNAGLGYGCAGLGGSEEVFVVVTSSADGLAVINQGGFCFAP